MDGVVYHLRRKFMESEYAIRRGVLFDRFVAQPGHQDITHGQYFFCPLCRDRFERIATGGVNPQLTLAHIIPQSLGGTWTTLACARCNNKLGRTIETDLLTSHHVSDWSTGLSSLTVRMGEGRVRAESQRNPDTGKLSFTVTTHPRNPAIATYKAHLERIRNELGETTQFTLPWFKPNACWAAVCQSAYLLLFKYFGYDFARHPSYSVLREQVLTPEDRIWNGNIHVLGNDESEKLLQGKQAAVVFALGDVKAILALLRFQSPSGVSQVLSVMLPGPGEPFHEQMKSLSLTLATVPYEPEIMGLQQGFFWWRWQNWMQNGE
jgi:hypothetical protein